ncbi:MAG: response regulator transcription factor [Phenylobacterium sp.]|jgi:two-component system, NarL family, nitrate/nitrite response regulator NarL|uniref:helix-turn-helix transcriptional regulator n=1 Tax=Phenylobacterium sp. TaxID=1871053 RepID=UPI00391A8BE7
MRIRIISHHPLCRDALAALARSELSAEILLSPDIEDPADAVADLLVYDLPPPGPHRDRQLAAAAKLGKRRLLVVPQRDLTLARMAHGAGFHGVLPKSAEPPLMAAIIRLVLAGGEYFPCFEEIIEAAPESEVIPESLSARQREVLGHMRLGRTNKEIAKLLGISVATVKLHVQAILNAAGARNRTEAVSRLLHRAG